MVLSADRIRHGFALLFVLGFFAFLFGPLVIMSLTAFNSSAFPRVSPWECFTVEWFDVLARDRRLITGLRNSLFIGLGVVLLSVPLGLAGALMLSQVRERIRPWYYTIVISPILIPGVVLGISTLLFWDRVGLMFGATRDSLFYNGFFLTIIGQSTFISAYTMLIFISRLQRFDTAQEEAALDLGATHWQSFRKILLPFLRPAIGSAAVLAFLASFENYNTTVFTAISTSTLTTVLASKVRYGINPSISALAVVIVVITVVGAAVHEVLKRRERRLAPPAAVAVPLAARPWYAEPALLMILLVSVAGTGTVYLAGTLGVEECKVLVRENKQRETQKRIEALRERRRQQAAEREAARAAEQGQAVDSAKSKVDKPARDRSGRTGTENFDSIFSSDNLAPGNRSDAPAADRPEPEAPTPRPGTENFESIFNTDNLAPGDD